ncbi:MAG: sce7726 family protein [Acholeplasmataceae bacterium]|nr:sce7726 family protein [Acholeplasmataceae bacterium]
MKRLGTDEARRLFDVYSPLKTNQQLLKHYQSILNHESYDETGIRDRYNEAIMREFLNEAVIKASFIKKHGFKESPEDTVLIFELNTGSSRADLCTFNGTSTVFEIKTAYDSYQRLKTQMDDYSKAYEHMNLIVPREHADSVKDMIFDQTGIITYERIGNRLNFDTYRKAVSHGQIDPEYQLRQLNKKQLSSVVAIKGLTREEMIAHLLSIHNKETINQIFIRLMKDKYEKRWSYLYDHRKDIKPLDYQWFFKNNLSVETVYV